MYGAEIFTSPAAGGSNEAVRVAKRLAAEHPDWVMLYQYGNEANARAHYETTGPEILADLPSVTHFVAGLGTTGTLMGTGRFLREHVPDVQDRRGRAAVRRAGLRAAQRGRGLRPRALRRVGADHQVLGVLGGRAPPDPRAARPRRASSPASRPAARCTPALAMAAQAVKAKERADIVVLVADGGWKYLSTGAYSGTLGEAEAEARRPALGLVTRAILITFLRGAQLSHASYRGWLFREFPGPDSAASCYLLEADGFRLVVDMGNGSLGALQRYAPLFGVDAVC